MLDQLAGMGAYQVTAGSHDLLASGLTETDLDPRLLAHYRAWPDLVRLIVRDRSGEGTLIYAPLATDVPAPSEPPASMRGARQA